MKESRFEADNHLDYLRDDPIAQFAEWYELAVNHESHDPSMMNLATCGSGGRPSARMVLLKQFDHRGFVFYTNSDSRKGNELRMNPYAALTMYWPTLDLQIRVEGPVEQIAAAEADAYFHSRPRESQISAWASNQSNPLESREQLEEAFRKISQEYRGKSIPRPPYWNGYRVIPNAIEFWRSGEYRLHDRVLYSRIDSSERWRKERLYP